MASLAVRTPEVAPTAGTPSVAKLVVLGVLYAAAVTLAVGLGLGLGAKPVPSAPVPAPAPLLSASPSPAASPTPSPVSGRGSGAGATGCPAGFFVNASVCTPCAAGSLSTKNNAVACSLCVAGTSSPAGAISCTPCAEGSYAPASGASGCSLCDPGSYSAGTKAKPACTACAVGTFAASPGSTSCAACYDAPSTGAASCTNCAAGFYYEATIGLCQLCPAGTYTAHAGATACAVCDGSGVAFAGATSCSELQACPAPSYQEGRGCACPPGWFVNPGEPLCTACSAGTSSTVPGATSPSTCGACAAGTHSSSPGATSCSLCVAGLYSLAGATVCETCVLGTYGPVSGASTCLPCDLFGGTGLTFPGATTCSQLYACPSPAITTYDIAPYYDMPLYGCYCPPGWYAAPPEPFCTLCAAGTYAPLDSATVYRGTRYSTSCTPCAAGTASAAAGATVCSSCDDGKTSDVGATVCTAPLL